MNKFWYRILFCLLNAAMCSAMNQKDDLFKRIADSVEQRYHKSSGFGDYKKALKFKKTGMQEFQERQALQENERRIQSNRLLAISRSRAELAKHEPFSDDWLDVLFGKCTGVENPDSIISCKDILEHEDNLRWPEVKQYMKQPEFGKRIMQHAVDTMYKKKEHAACNLAAAICLGGDPDSRESGSAPHTALHIAGMRDHFGLFNLLLEKGANPNLRCMPQHPLTFNKDERFQDQLLKRGSYNDDKDDE